MCAHTWAPIKICTHMLVHETPHTRNYTHKAHRCTLIHTKMHKCMPPTHAHQTHTLAFSLSLPLSVPQAGQEPRSPIWRLGREHLRQESAHECLCVADWVCLLCVSVCKAGASGLHWLSAGRSRAPLPTAAPLPAWSPTFLSAPRACSPGLGNLFTAAREQAGRGAQPGHLLVSVLGLSFSDCDPEGWFLGVPRILHCPEPTSLLHKEPKP